MTPINPDTIIEQDQELTKLNQLYQLRDLMDAYVIKNILLVSVSPNSKVETFDNPNLYRLAVQYYGDMNYWTVIAKANNLSDPKYNGVISLIIPPKPTVDSGGVLKPQ